MQCRIWKIRDSRNRIVTRWIGHLGVVKAELRISQLQHTKLRRQSWDGDRIWSSPSHENRFHNKNHVWEAIEMCPLIRSLGSDIWCLELIWSSIFTKSVHGIFPNVSYGKGVQSCLLNGNGDMVNAVERIQIYWTSWNPFPLWDDKKVKRLES